MTAELIAEIITGIVNFFFGEILVPSIPITVGILVAKEIERRREEKRKNPPT